MRRTLFRLVCTVVMVAPFNNFANTLNLSPTEDGMATTGDASSIQAALDMAVDGDVVNLGPGTYYVSGLSFPRRSIRLVGSSTAPETVVLDGSAAENVQAVLLASWSEEEPPLSPEEWPTVEGLTLQRSAWSGLELDGCQLEITNIVVKDSHETGILVHDSFVSITGSRIEGNQRGGIYAIYSDAMPVLPNVNGLQIMYSHIANNDTTGDGGGLFYYNKSGLTKAAVISCTFEANSATHGGGIFAETGLYPLRLEDVSVSGNAARSSGGGIYSLFGGVSMGGGELTENVAVRGGGMYGADMELDGVRIIGNEADEGGGSYFHGDLYGVEVSGNKARAGGGLMVSECVSDQWGYACGDTSILYSEIRENQAAELGGGLVVSDADSFGRSTVKEVIVQGNTAPEGAGVLSHNDSDLYQDVTVADNSASGSGGGMWLSGDQTLERVVLVGNSASSGAALYGEDFGGRLSNAVFMWNEATDGGGLYLADSTAVLENVTIAANSASGMGGGLFVSQPDSGTGYDNTRWLGLRFSIVAFNSASDGANLYLARGKSMDFSANLFYSEDGFFDHSGSDGIGLPGDTIVEDPYLMIEDGPALPQVPQLRLGSPAINAGPPTWRDVDGSLLDLGATGGEKADRWGIACEDHTTSDDDEECPRLVPLVESSGCTMVTGARPSSAGMALPLCVLGLAVLRWRAGSTLSRRNPALASRPVAPSSHRSG